jgi:hypothetical protein
LFATGLDAATSRSPVFDVIVMNTAALAVPPTVSRVHTSVTSTCAGVGPQDKSGNSSNKAKATRRTTISLRRPGRSVDRTFDGSKRLQGRAPRRGTVYQQG